MGEEGGAMTAIYDSTPPYPEERRVERDPKPDEETLDIARERRAEDQQRRAG
jgi:hypothetical protein